MVVNSTNLTKRTINHLFSQLNLLNTEKTTTYDVRNPDPSLGQAHKYGGFNRLMLSELSPFDNLLSNDNTYI